MGRVWIVTLHKIKESTANDSNGSIVVEVRKEVNNTPEEKKCIGIKYWDI